MKREKKHGHPPAEPTAKALREAQTLRTQSRRHQSDVLGAYTGTNADGEAPEQDADDL
ncbi:MAG: hypothetical protein IJD01_03970 [Clostridia bacterium]|nr:hypothetical protein [Clostridia bacterium]